MTNAQRRQIVDDAKARGYQGSYVDLFRQAAVDPESVVRHGTQESIDGLRPAHQAGNTEASMAFTDVPPNTPFNTVGMKKPIDIKKYDRQGHLVKSYESVPPGIQSLDTGPNTGTVIETPARMQQGNFTNSDIPRVPALSDAEMSLKIIQEANSGNPAARRMRSDYGQRMFLEGETDPSTHYMGSFGKYAVPLVQEDYIGGPLRYDEDPAPSKADFKFDTPEQAEYFAKNYKQASAAKAFNKKMQEGGFDESGNPIAILEAVDLENYMAKTRGQTPEFWKATADTLAYHENAIPMTGSMSLTRPQIGGGPGVGLFQFESKNAPGRDAFETAKQRYINVAKETEGFKPDPAIVRAKSAAELSKEQQYAVFHANLIEGPAKLSDYAKGKMSITDLWLKGHKGVEKPGDRESFEESRQAAKKDNFKKYGLRHGGVRYSNSRYKK